MKAADGANMNPMGKLIGREIRSRRMSRAELARQARVHRSTIGRIVSGEVLPRPSTLTRIYSALAERLIPRQRQVFISTAANSGVPIDAASDISSQKTTSELGPIAEHALVKETLDRMGLDGWTDPDGLRLALPWLVVLNHNGLGLGVIEYCSVVMKGLDRYGSDSAERRELTSELLQVQSIAMLTASQAIGFRRGIQTARKAIQIVSHPAVPASARRDRRFGAALALGNIARIIEDVYSSRPTKLLVDLHAACVEPFDGTDPLELAALTDSPVERAWAHSELMKRFSRTGDKQRIQDHFKAAISEMDTQAFKSDPRSRLVLPMVYESAARSIIEESGASDEAQALLDFAGKRAQLEVNKFQVRLSDCKRLLKSPKRGLRLDGKDALQTLVAPDTHQAERADNLAETVGVERNQAA